MKFEVTVSKGEVTYEVEAEDRAEAEDLAEEWYESRDFEVFDVKEITKDKEKKKKDKKKKDKKK